MKRYTSFAIMALVLVLGAFAARSYSSPENAALSCTEVTNCLNLGYNMDSCVTKPIYYIVKPTGTYNWGNVEVMMSHTELPNILATVNIEARDSHGRMVFREVGHTTQTP